MKRRRFLATPLLLVAGAGLAAEGYPPVLPGRKFQFPRDHGSHPDFRTEWWYVTGWVQDERGRDIGIQVTFFRNRPRIAEANPSRFAPRQLLFAHAALADPRHGRLRHDQRVARAGFSLAEASEEATDVRIGDWSLRQEGEVYRARIATREFSFDLAFAPTQPILPQGDAGFSRKGPAMSEASYYYSGPQLAVSGKLAIGRDSESVTGLAWLDHEWSSEVMAPTAVGWDWVGVNLADGGALMAFRMRDRAGAALWAGGTLRTADGRVRAIGPADIRFDVRRRWRSPRTGIDYPIALDVTVGDARFVLEPLFDDQELDSRGSTGAIYWEGAVQALQDGRVAGRGYLELTGYGAPLKL